MQASKPNETLPYPSGRYEHGYPTGGIHLTKDSDIVGKTIRFVLGSIGHNLITGHFTSLLSIRTPADSHRPETYLQTIIKDFTYAEAIVKKASLVSDPVEKLKLMSLNLFVSIHELGE